MYNLSLIKKLSNTPAEGLEMRLFETSFKEMLRASCMGRRQGRRLV